MKNIFVLFYLSISCLFCFAQTESSFTSNYKNGKLYINNNYVSPSNFKNNITKKNYGNFELETIDSNLLDMFSEENCENIRKCKLDYLDSIFLMHKNNPELNSEAFGLAMYRYIVKDLNNKLIYLDIRNKFILDALIGEIEIEYNSPKEIWEHITLFQEIINTKTVSQGQKEGVVYLVNELKRLSSSNVIVFSRDSYVNLREAPSLKSKIVRQLKNGTNIVIKNMDGDWFFVTVSTPQINIKGYIHKSGVISQ